MDLGDFLARGGDGGEGARVDGELLPESQLTGDRQWPHCVRGLDLDFLLLSSPGVASPGADWPGVRSVTVGGPRGWTVSAGLPRGLRRTTGPVPRGIPARAGGARGRCLRSRVFLATPCQEFGGKNSGLSLKTNAA